MTKVAVLNKSQTITIGKEPVVLVPLKLWRQVEDYLEDQEALASKRYLRRIKEARKAIKSGKGIRPFR